MRGIWEDQLPPDDPIFTGGVRFVLGPKMPPSADDDDAVAFVSPNVPGRKASELSQLDSETASEESD
jgi:hypothetical protein